MAHNKTAEFPRVRGFNLTGNDRYFATMAYRPSAMGASIGRYQHSDGASLLTYSRDEAGEPAAAH